MIELPALQPDASRASRTRARCHNKLIHANRPRNQRRFALERRLFLCFGALYMTSVAFDVMRVLLH
jgi:hypothetical protein